MLSWTYWRETEIEVTDGRQHMYLSLSVIPQLDVWFTCGVSAQDFRSYQNILTTDTPILVWHGFGHAPGVGSVRRTVRWPREEVQQLVRAVLVAERLRAKNKPHTIYVEFAN